MHLLLPLLLLLLPSIKERKMFISSIIPLINSMMPKSLMTRTLDSPEILSLVNLLMMFKRLSTGLKRSQPHSLTKELMKVNLNSKNSKVISLELLLKSYSTSTKSMKNLPPNYTTSSESLSFKTLINMKTLNNLPILEPLKELPHLLSHSNTKIVISNPKDSANYLLSVIKPRLKLSMRLVMPNTITYKLRLPLILALNLRL